MLIFSSFFHAHGVLHRVHFLAHAFFHTLGFLRHTTLQPALAALHLGLARRHAFIVVHLAESVSYLLQVLCVR